MASDAGSRSAPPSNFMKENTELDELQRRLHDAHESSANLRDTIDRLKAEIEDAKSILRKELDREYDAKDTLHTLVVVATNALFYAKGKSI